MAKAKSENKLLKNDKVTILVDYRYVLYRSGFRFNEMQITRNSVTLLTGAIYGVLELVIMIRQNYPNSKIIFCLDGEPTERLKIFPQYKGQRHQADPPQEIVCARKLHDEPIKILKCVDDVEFIKHPNKEADDLAAIFAYREKAKGRKALIFSGDKDYLQTVKDGIMVAKSFESNKFEIMDENTILAHKDLGVEAKDILYFRALEGDKSDEIPAAVGGSKDLKREFARYWSESNDKYLEHYDELLNRFNTEVIQKMFKGKKAQQNNLEKYLEPAVKEAMIRNLKLMDLQKYKVVYDSYSKYKESRNKEDLKEAKKFTNGVKLVDFDLSEDDIKKLLRNYQLSRFTIWAKGAGYLKP